MSTNSILTIDALGKKFFSNTVLTDIHFSLYKGEVLSLLGENGAGKSTLVKILSGVYPFQSYEGAIYNEQKQELRFHSIKDANDFGIAMIYQEISVEYDLSVAENIMLGLLKRNTFGFLDWKAIKEDAKKILDMLQFDVDVDIPVRNLSASQQQIICIARALSRNPHILILDEPTASLTENEISTLFSVIETLKAQGISCIYISHRLQEVFTISDRVLVLRDGTLISSYEKKNFDKKRIIRDMIGKEVKDEVAPMSIEKNTQEVLRVENIRLLNPHNKDLTIIDDISFSAYKGEIVGIAGMLGSGRSELLRAIYGSYPLESGNIYVHEKQVHIQNAHQAIDNGIGFLTEERKKDGFVKTMNIKHNASLNILQRLCKLKYFLSFSSEQKIVDAFLKRMNYRGPEYSSSILYLSGGNQQKVIFSKILMTNSNVLLLDEPTRGIDVGAKQEIYTIIEELQKEGITVILVSSEFSELMRLSSRILVLHSGKIVKELAPNEFNEEHIVHITSFGT